MSDITDDLGRLSATSKLPLLTARAALKQSAWLAPAALLSPAQFDQALAPPHNVPSGHWAIWSELASTGTPTLLPSTASVGRGSLGIFWLGEGLPLVCVTLASSTHAARIGVILWSSAARSWLNDVMTSKQLRVVIERPDGELVLHIGDLDLRGRDCADLVDCEYSVEPPDRGHALRAAALVLLAQPAISGPNQVRVVAEAPTDTVELMQLAQITAHPGSA